MYHGYCLARSTFSFNSVIDSLNVAISVVRFVVQNLSYGMVNINLLVNHWTLTNYLSTEVFWSQD
jgi:hypothetical protein